MKEKEWLVSYFDHISKDNLKELKIYLMEQVDKIYNENQ